MMRRIALGLLFVITAMFSLGSIASADVVVEPVSASSPEEGQVTFANGGTPATVKYGPARGSLVSTVKLVPNQVVTVSVINADTIYWQATTVDGTSSVHGEDTVPVNGFVVFFVVLGVACVLFFIVYGVCAFMDGPYRY